MATECPVCRGRLRVGPRYATIQSYQCYGCGEWFQQVLPRWYVDALALTAAA